MRNPKKDLELFNKAAEDEFSTDLGELAMDMIPYWISEAEKLKISDSENKRKYERLKNISEGDCIAEGCPKAFLQGKSWYVPLWESINGPGSWDANPWVWCISFKRV